MDRYQKVEKQREETPIDENEIRITSQGRMRSYITYAMSLIQEKGSNEIVFKAMGRAINKTVTIVELIKRRIVGLHQITSIGSIDITDTWEPLEEGLLPLETTRHVSMIMITLSLKELNTSSVGYQPPIPADQVKPSTDFDNEGGEGSPTVRGRGRGGRGRGRPRSTGNGYADGEYENGGYDRNHGFGRGRGRGRNFRGRGRGGYNAIQNDGYQGGRGGYNAIQNDGYQGGKRGYNAIQNDGYQGGRGGGGRGGYNAIQNDGYQGGRGGYNAIQNDGYQGGKRGYNAIQKDGYQGGRGGYNAIQKDGYQGGRGGYNAPQNDYQDDGGYYDAPPWGRGRGRGRGGRGRGRGFRPNGPVHAPASGA